MGTMSVEPPGPTRLSETEKLPSGVRCRAYGRFVEWLAGTRGERRGNHLQQRPADRPGGPPRGRLLWRSWKFQRPMGIATDGRRMALATRGAVLRLMGTGVEIRAGGSRRFPQTATGRVDAHDVALLEGRVLFANTRRNCIARAKPDKGYGVHWRPSFVDPTVRRDQCHLNGIGVRDGRLAVVTLFGRTAEAGGWRSDDRFASGLLLEVPTERVLASGLCMPHSPRWHDGAWWLCDSGRGALCRLDKGGRLESVVTLPGFTRGLCLAHGCALVGRSRFRDEHVLDTARVVGREQTPRSGVSLVDLTSGEEIGGVDFLAGGREVYEVLLLPGLPRPSIIVSENHHGDTEGTEKNKED